ncbi:unnamed protein product [Rotaria sp. Silwood2]|nr:unnamed protein product [Rotaria sp. Silwood2]
MKYARSYHQASLLPDGRVLITGGYGERTVNTTELYDPSTETFSVGPHMASARSFHKATILKDGKVLVTGGSTGSRSLETAELYFP